MPYEAEVGFVYFLHSPEVQRVKIGFAAMPPRRIEGIRNASPVELEWLGVIPGSRDDEAALHARFKEFRVRREWFSADPALMAFIRSEALPWSEDMIERATSLANARQAKAACDRAELAAASGQRPVLRHLRYLL